MEFTTPVPIPVVPLLRIANVAQPAIAEIIEAPLVDVLPPAVGVEEAGVEVGAAAAGAANPTLPLRPVSKPTDSGDTTTAIIRPESRVSTAD